MHVLITGITGFVGSYLADYLLTLDGLEVHGTIRKRSRTENVEHLRGKVRFVECDLRDMASVLGMLRQVQPARIFHLAAQSFVPTSWKAPADTLTNNIMLIHETENSPQVGAESNFRHSAGGIVRAAG